MHKKFQQPVFLGREVHLLAVTGDAAFFGEQAQIGMLQDPSLTETTVAAPQQGAATGNQFAHAKGFDQVVIGTHLQAQDPIALTVTGTYHQDRDAVFALTDLTAEIKAIKPRQHQIQDHQGEGGPLGSMLHQGKGFAAITAGSHLVSLQDQGFANRVANRVVILDDQQGGGHAAILL